MYVCINYVYNTSLFCLLFNDQRIRIRTKIKIKIIFAEECVKFLTQQGKELNLDVKIFEIVKNKPIVILTKRGANSRLPSILLNSHMDVVPVFPV